MQDPLVTVIIPVYNVEPYLKKCVDSVLNQTYKNLEILLVDDGSTDACPQICDEYLCSDVRVKVFHKENGGLSSARNMALNEFQGDYIVFVDSDDWIRQTMIERMLYSALNSNADISICGFGIENRGKILQYPIKTLAGVIDNEVLMKEYVRNTDIKTIVCNKLYRANLFGTVKFPLGKVHEDVFVVHELLGQCKKATIVKESMYIQLIRDGSITQSAFSERDFSLLEADEKIMNYYKRRYPHLYQYVAGRKANDAAILMERILKDFSLHKKKESFIKLYETVSEEYAIISTNYPESIKPLTRLAVNYIGCFILRGYYFGIRHLFGQLFKSQLNT